MSVERAELLDGRKVEYVMAKDPSADSMTNTHFAPDRSYVVHFFSDQVLLADPNRRRRAEMLVGFYNPTLDPKHGPYWRDLFWWPTGVVVKPRLGIVSPICRPKYVFSDGRFKGDR